MGLLAEVTKPAKTNPATRRSEAKTTCIGAFLLIFLTVLAYVPALSGKFVWDDDSWTTGIAGLLRNVGGLRTIWCQPAAMQQYYPLTGTTFWVDYHLWGFHSVPYHVENVLLHAFAAVLFWRLLRRLAVPGAWLAGAIFALHPVMVESAAWITERKNVLSLVFYLGALLAYLRYTGRRAGENSPNVSRGDTHGGHEPGIRGKGVISSSNPLTPSLSPLGGERVAAGPERGFYFRPSVFHLCKSVAE